MVPITRIPLVEGSHRAEGEGLVELVRNSAAPLSGQSSSRWVPVPSAASFTGTASGPRAVAAGSTLPPVSNKERFSQPAVPTPFRRWYSVRHVVKEDHRQGLGLGLVRVNERFWTPLGLTLPSQVEPGGGRELTGVAKGVTRQRTCQQAEEQPKREKPQYWRAFASCLSC